MMPTIRTSLLLILVTTIATGCSATRGTPFERSEVPEIEIGKTRRDTLTSAIGAPFNFGFVAKNQFEYSVYHWSYSKASPSGARNRLLRVGFGPNDRVAFWMFRSNFEEDSTDFDISALRSLSPNRTTGEEVLERLGEPTGYDFTYVGDHRYQTWIYSVARLENAERPLVKQATLHFQNGILMWFELQGEGFVLE